MFPIPILRIIIEYEFANIWEVITHESSVLSEFIKCLKIFNISKDQCIEHQLLQNACVYGDLNVAKYLQQEYSLNTNDVIRVMRINIGFNMYGWTYRSIYKNNKIDSFIWFVDTFKIDKISITSMVREVCRDGQLELLKWIKSKYGIDKNIPRCSEWELFRAALINGRLDTAKWLKEEFGWNKDNIDTGYFMVQLCHRLENDGNKDALKWLKEIGFYNDNECVML
jgi:hypothetical protein